MIENQDLLNNVAKSAELFRNKLTSLQRECDCIIDIRIQGMMIGIEVSVDGASVVQACLERQLLVNCTQGNVIRLLPAMTITEADVEEGCQKLTEAILEVASRT